MRGQGAVGGASRQVAGAGRSPGESRTICFSMNVFPWRRATGGRAKEEVPGAKPGGAVEMQETTSEYANAGLERWHAVRREWTAEALPERRRRMQKRLTEQQEDEIYDDLLCADHAPLPAHTSLADVIRILPEVWEKVGVHCARICMCVFLTDLST